MSTSSDGCATVLPWYSNSLLSWLAGNQNPGNASSYHENQLVSTGLLWLGLVTSPYLGVTGSIWMGMHPTSWMNSKFTMFTSRAGDANLDWLLINSSSGGSFDLNSPEIGVDRPGSDQHPFHIIHSKKVWTASMKHADFRGPLRGVEVISSFRSWLIWL